MARLAFTPERAIELAEQAASMGSSLCLDDGADRAAFSALLEHVFQGVKLSHCATCRRPAIARDLDGEGNGPCCGE